MPDVSLEQVNKIYGNDVHAVRDLNLDLEQGEFLVLVGPSGCGKTTALRMVAGLEDVSSGSIVIGDRVVNDVAPRDRDIAMVFQNYALYPHMDVRQNIGYGLRMRRMPKADIAERVQRASRLLDLEGLLDRKPRQLSGGQRQRVAMGRAIVREPRVFLMDEPLSNLDANLRVQMRADIAELQHELGVTTIYVTHDQVEAMTMGHRVAVMRDGVLQQVDPPQHLYDHPRNLFVAAFIGSPPMNLALAELVHQDGALIAQLGDQRLRVPDSVVAARPALRGYAGRQVVLGIRPEDLTGLGAAERAGDAVLRSRVELTESLGSELHLHIDLPVDQPTIADTVRSSGRVPSGSTRWIAVFNPRSRVAVGETVDIAVDTERIHVFDPGDGEAIAAA